MELWWKQYTRWRARNFIGKNQAYGDGWMYRIEYHDGRYWRTDCPQSLRFGNKEAAEAYIRQRGFEPEPYNENEKTVRWWRER